MFTGIIQQVGQIKEVIPQGDGSMFWIDAGAVAPLLKPKESLAVNGTCLTVEECAQNLVRVTAIHQTLQMTTLGNLQQGSRVNLEPAATLSSFLGGHLVQGHVDGIATLREIVPRETGCEMIVNFPAEWMRYVIDKGSIALDGVSLTVAEKGEDFLRIALIPETLERTILSDWAVGTEINVEVDPIGKYVENFMRGLAAEGKNR